MVAPSSIKMLSPISVLVGLAFADFLFLVSLLKSCSIAWWFFVKISVTELIEISLKSVMSIIFSKDSELKISILDLAATIVSS